MLSSMTEMRSRESAFPDIFIMKFSSHSPPTNNPCITYSWLQGEENFQKIPVSENFRVKQQIKHAITNFTIYYFVSKLHRAGKREDATGRGWTRTTNFSRAKEKGSRGEKSKSKNHIICHIWWGENPYKNRLDLPWEYVKDFSNECAFRRKTKEQELQEKWRQRCRF